MNEKTTVLIEYIGRREPRKDNVLNTRRVWEHHGSVVEVPANEAPHYTKYSDVWRKITAEELEQRKQARAAADENISGIKGVWQDLSIADLEKLKADIVEEIARRRSEVKAVEDNETPAHDDPGVSIDSPDDMSATAAAERLKKIADVVVEMDPNDPEQYTKPPNSLPMVDYVSEQVGFKVTRREITEAMALFGGE